MQNKESSAPIFKLETKQDMMRLLKEKEDMISDIIKNIPNKLRNQKEAARQGAEDILSINKGLFSAITAKLSIIPDSEFVLCQEELNKKIGNLVRKIDSELKTVAGGITSIVRETGGGSLRENCMKRPLNNMNRSDLTDDAWIRAIQLAKEEIVNVAPAIKKGAVEISTQHSAFSTILKGFSHPSSLYFKGRIPVLQSRLLKRLKSWRDGIGCTNYAKDKRTELDNIKEKIKSSCDIAISLLAHEEKYQKEEEQLRYAKGLDAWSRELEEALASLKQAHINDFQGGYSEAVAKILNDNYLLKSLENKIFVDLEARRAQLKKFHNLLAMPCIVLSASCFLSRRFNIMPNKNPFTMMNSKHPDALYSATAAVVSACLILYTVRCILPKKRMNDMLSKYSRRSAANEQNIVSK